MHKFNVDHLHAINSIIVQLKKGLALKIESMELKRYYITTAFFVDKILHATYMKQKKHHFSDMQQQEMRILIDVIESYIKILQSMCHDTCFVYQEVIKQKSIIKKRIDIYQKRLQIVWHYLRSQQKKGYGEIVTEEEYAHLFTLSKKS